MKEHYEDLAMRVLTFESEDVITESNEGEDGGGD